jgi:IS5 family transposase
MCNKLKLHHNYSWSRDNESFRAFARLCRGQTPIASRLQENIKRLSEETWEALNRAIVGISGEQGIEKGRTVRMDSTAVETNVHHPTDSSLLEEGVRIITRLLIRGKRLSPSPAYRYSDHRRVVKKRALAILNDKKKGTLKKCHKDLLDIALQVSGYAPDAIELLESFVSPEIMQILEAHGLAEELERVSLASLTKGLTRPGAVSSKERMFRPPSLLSRELF